MPRTGNTNKGSKANTNKLPYKGMDIVSRIDNGLKEKFPYVNIKSRFNQGEIEILVDGIIYDWNMSDNNEQQQFDLLIEQINVLNNPDLSALNIPFDGIWFNMCWELVFDYPLDLPASDSNEYVLKAENNKYYVSANDADGLFKELSNIEFITLSDAVIAKKYEEKDDISYNSDSLISDCFGLSNDNIQVESETGEITTVDGTDITSDTGLIELVKPVITTTTRKKSVPSEEKYDKRSIAIGSDNARKQAIKPVTDFDIESQWFNTGYLCLNDNTLKSGRDAAIVLNKLWDTYQIDKHVGSRYDASNRLSILFDAYREITVSVKDTFELVTKTDEDGKLRGKYQITSEEKKVTRKVLVPNKKDSTLGLPSEHQFAHKSGLKNIIIDTDHAIRIELADGTLILGSKVSVLKSQMSKKNETKGQYNTGEIKTKMPKIKNGTRLATQLQKRVDSSEISKPLTIPTCLNAFHLQVLSNGTIIMKQLLFSGVVDKPLGVIRDYHYQSDNQLIFDWVLFKHNEKLDCPQLVTAINRHLKQHRSETISIVAANNREIKMTKNAKKRAFRAGKLKFGC